MDSAPQNLSSLIQGNTDILQEKLNSFVEQLQYLGLDKTEIETISGGITVTATKQMMAKVSALMDEQEFEKWKIFVDTGVNNAQQLIVLNKMLINKTNKDFETIFMEIVDGLIENTLKDLARIKDLNVKVSQLSPEEIEKATQLLDSGDFQGADSIINKQE